MNDALAPAAPVSNPPTSAISPRALVAILMGLNLIRLASSFFIELFPQEAYYFLYSRHLALSYFDHPPVLAFLLRGFTEVFGQHELTLRLAAFSVSVATQWVWLDLARRHLGARWSRAAVLLLTTGAITVTTLISTPDVPLLLFWSVAVHQLHRALFEGRRSGWLTAGVAMGLAFDSKYTGILLQAGLGLFLLLSREHRRHLRTAWPWLSVLLAHLVMAPVYIWNAQHHFASFLFQTSERAAHSTGLGPRWILGLLGSQSVLVGPFLFVALLVLIVRFRALLTDARRLFLACFFAPTFVGFLGISLFAQVKPNWLLPAYLTGVLLAAELPGARWPRWNVGFAALVHVLAAIELIFYPVRIQSDDTWRGWRELSVRVQEAQARHPGAFIASADGYKTSAELRFYAPKLEVYGPNLVGERGLQFDYTDPDLAHLRGRDALFIDSTPRDFTPGKGAEIPTNVRSHFASVEEVDPILIVERGRVVRKFRVYACREYLASKR